MSKNAADVSHHFTCLGTAFKHKTVLRWENTN